jgi:addiction module HigA family antidote
MTDATFIHAGEHLEEFLDEYGISQSQFAKIIGVSPSRINRIINRQSPITAEMALRIGRAFRMSAETWMNLQQMYDLEVARAAIDVSGIEPLVDELPDDWTPPLEAERPEHAERSQDLASSAAAT